MWKHIRTTILILLTGTLIGILVGNLSVPKAATGLDDTGTFRAPKTGESGVSTVGSAAAYNEPVAIEMSGEPAESYSELRNEKADAGLTDAAVSERMQREIGHYCYDMLDDDLKRVYAEVLMILEAHGEDILISTTNNDDLHTVFLCVFQDHPEIYWCDGYYYRRYERGIGQPCFTFGGRYTYTAAECEAYEPQIRDYIRQCLQKLPSGADQYETVKYIYEYVILNTDYDIGAKDSQNILSVMLYRKSVCQGYAKTVQYLLQEVGIPATLVVGSVYGDSQGHAWNLVKIDGAYYYLDATWGDAAFRLSQGEETAGAEEINYRFLNVTSEDLDGTHISENPVPMPYCVSTEANYYVREGCFFSEYDRMAFRDLFLGARADGSHVVSIKLSDDAAYRSVREELIGQQSIFDLLPSGEGRVSYSEDPGLRILTFYF